MRGVYHFRWIGSVGLSISVALVVIVLSGSAQQPSAPMLPRDLELQRQVDDLTEQLRQREFELAGCQGQLASYVRTVNSDLQARRASWKEAVEKALGPEWTVNEKLSIVKKQEDKK